MSPKLLIPRNVAFLVLSLGALFSTQLAGAGLLNIPKMLSGAEMNQFDNLDLDNMTSEGNSFQTSQSFIDNSIDQDAYMIGMGDVFSVSIVEIPSVSYSAIVNQHCDVYIPELGLLTLGKISLREAVAAISSFVKTKLKSNNTIYVSLQEGKRVSVSVNGPVSGPGTYIVDGIMRIGDCILKANKMELPSIANADLRNVTVTRIDTTIHLDFYRYLLTNDVSQNPYVYPGDRIFITSPTNHVYISGELVNPTEGFIPIKPNETLADFMGLLSLSGSADLSHIVVQEGGSNSSRTTSIFTSETAQNCILNDMDIISFASQSNYPQQITVSISGAINRPGVLPAVHSVTTVKDVITLAGGYRSNADSSRGYILRNQKSLMAQNKSSNNNLNIEKVALNTPGSIRPEVNLSLSRLNSFHDYTTIALTKENSNISLERGDHIFIPFTEEFVYVSGCVAHPGAYPYVSGEKRNYYIKQAGNFSSKSDRGNTYILTSVHTALQIREGSTILPGDIIVVPDSQTNKTLITFILPMLQIISTAVYVIIAINSVTAKSSSSSN